MTETKKCPNCGEPAVEQFRPFCSARCSEVDLGRWLGGRYTVPVMESESTEDAQPKTGDTLGGRGRT